MNLFEQMLSQAKPGTEIKLTLSSGQVIAGVVTQNDNTAALAVQITSTAVVRYDQIAAIEHKVMNPNAVPQPQGNLSPETPVQKISLADVKIPEFSCIQKLAEQYSSLTNEQKKELQSPYNKVINGVKNHDADKVKQATNSLWNIVENDDNLYYDPHVMQLTAYVFYLNQEYEEAWESFFDGDNLRAAYLAAGSISAGSRFCSGVSPEK